MSMSLKEIEELRRAKSREYQRKYRKENRVKLNEYHRKYRLKEDRREKALEFSTNWKLKNKKEYDKRRRLAKKKPAEKIKNKAWQKVYKAIKAGILKKPIECTKCKKRRLIEAHHEDYSKPLEIVWLCRLCHGGRRTEN